MTTEKSPDDGVLDDVFSSGRDRGSKSAPPVADIEPDKARQLEAAPEKVEQQAPAEQQDESDKPKGYRDPATGRFVPLTELQSEREKRQEAQKAREEEARLRQEAEQRSADYQRRLEALERNFQAAQQPRQQPTPPPDPLTDPEGAFSHLSSTFAERLLHQNLNFSERIARMQHGDAIVDAAFQAAEQLGIKQQFVRAQDPYGDLVKWHKRKQALDRVGEDPDAYEQRIRDAERQKVLDELRTGGVNRQMPAPNGQHPQQPRFPQGLADAPSAGPNVAQPVTDEAVMASVFGSGRKRKA